MGAKEDFTFACTQKELTAGSGIPRREVLIAPVLEAALIMIVALAGWVGHCPSCSSASARPHMK